MSHGLWLKAHGAWPASWLMTHVRQEPWGLEQDPGPSLFSWSGQSDRRAGQSDRGAGQSDRGAGQSDRGARRSDQGAGRSDQGVWGPCLAKTFHAIALMVSA